MQMHKKCLKGLGKEKISHAELQVTELPCFWHPTSLFGALLPANGWHAQHYMTLAARNTHLVHFMHFLNQV